MIHPFGELLRTYRRRKPGLTQERLAHQIGYDEAVLVRMSQGKKDLTGPSGRDRVVRLIEALHEHGVLNALDEANTLLASANQPPIYDGLPIEHALRLKLRPSSSTMTRVSRGHFTPPASASELIGREMELAEIEQLLKSARLVTLTGAGGSGKTRLALESAAALINEYPNGACFVSLASVRQSNDMLPAIAHTLDVRDLGDRPLIETIQHFLANKSLLLVLDNFEHLLEQAHVVSRLLAAAPRLKIIATSRESLRISGEHIHAVEPLALAGAIELFEQRARAVKPHFSIDGAQREVAEVCRRMDCLPLAVELAAARVRQFSPRALLEKLAGASAESPLHVLVNAPRDAPARHRTMRDTIAWSYALLSAPEQQLLRLLGIFVNGAEAEQIFALSPESVMKHKELEDLLLSLVDKNLVRMVEQADGTLRYVLLELVREFVLEQLRELGELAMAQRNHATAFAALAEKSARPIRGHSQMVWVNRLERDYPNFRAALTWCFGRSGDGVTGCRLAGNLAHFWFVATKYLAETRDWTQKALAAKTADMPPSVLGDVCASLIVNGHLWTHSEWISPSREALLNYRISQNERGIAFALYGLAAGLLGVNLGDEEGARVSHECLTLARKIGDKWITGHILHVLAANAMNMGDLALAEGRYREMVNLRRSIGNVVEVAIGLWQLSEVHSQSLRFQDAIHCLQESALLARQIDSPHDVVHADCSIEGSRHLSTHYAWQN